MTNTNDDIYRGLRAYQKYIAIRNHFTTNYDYFKYKGKSSASGDSFLKRKDKFFFAKLEKNYKPAELTYYFVSQFVDGDTVWSGNLVSEQSAERYREWKKRVQSLRKIFREDIEGLSHVPFNDWFEVEEYDHPVLLKQFMRKDIRPESMIIIDMVVGYLERWNKQMNDPSGLWDNYYKTLTKYKPFIATDVVVKTYKDILLENVK